VRHDVCPLVEDRLAIDRKESEQHSRRLRTLQDEQQKLVQLYYKGGVSEEVLQAEQTRIESERTQAERLVKAASHEAADVLDALAIVGRCHETYLQASPMLSRLMNQVIFHRILIHSELIECDLQPVFGHITRLGRGLPGPRQAPAAPERPRPPVFWGSWFQRRPNGAEPGTKTEHSTQARDSDPGSHGVGRSASPKTCSRGDPPGACQRPRSVGC
jgi:hypothetical protein